MFESLVQKRNQFFRKRTDVFPLILALRVVVADFCQYWYINRFSLFGLMWCDLYNRDNNINVISECELDSAPVAHIRLKGARIVETV